MRCVVTGAAGFIGSHLSDALLERGHDVLGIDCFTDYYDARMKEDNARGRHVQRLDLAEETLDFTGSDAVFHLAGQPGTRSFGNAFHTYLRRNLLATQRVFEAAIAAEVPVVWASSSSVYGDADVYPTSEGTALRPTNPYGITKLGCEHLQSAYEHAFGLHAVALRYFTVYGPRQRPDMAFARMIEALIHGQEFEIYGDGLQSRSFTYVSDVVEATIRALGATPGVYNVGGGEEARLRDVVSTLEAITGEHLRVACRPQPRGDVQRTRADISKIERELGWSPQIDLGAGLARHCEWAAARAATA